MKQSLVTKRKVFSPVSCYSTAEPTCSWEALSRAMESAPPESSVSPIVLFSFKTNWIWDGLNERRTDRKVDMTTYKTGQAGRNIGLATRQTEQTERSSWRQTGLATHQTGYASNWTDKKIRLATRHTGKTERQAHSALDWADKNIELTTRQTGHTERSGSQCTTLDTQKDRAGFASDWIKDIQKYCVVWWKRFGGM